MPRCQPAQDQGPCGTSKNSERTVESWSSIQSSIYLQISIHLHVQLCSVQWTLDWLLCKSRSLVEAKVNAQYQRMVAQISLSDGLNHPQATDVEKKKYH